MFVPSLFTKIYPQSEPAISTPVPIPMSCAATTAPIKAQLVPALSASNQGELYGKTSSPSDTSSNARTRGQFKPRNANKGTSSYQLRQFAEATLGSGSLRKAVKLPEGEDLNEWLAVNGTTTSVEQRFTINVIDLQQLSISTTRSTSSMAQLQSSALRNHARR